jgi:hypothetical protein
MKRLALFFMLVFLSGCSWLGGGATYHYTYETNGTKVQIYVDSARDIKNIDVMITPSGKVSLKAEGLAPGANNLGDALGIIDKIVKAGAVAAIP